MTSRHADILLAITAGVCKDASALDKSLASGFRRDIVRLESLVRRHGVSVFTLMLPAIGKVLDQALDQGFLEPINLPLSRPINGKTNIPRLFQGIWLKVFTMSGQLRSSDDLDPTFVLILRQLYAVGGKVDIDCKPEKVYKTYEDFFDVEAELPPPNREVWGAAPVALSHEVTGSLCDLVDSKESLLNLYAADTVSSAITLRLAQQVADLVVVSTFGEDRDKRLAPEDLRFKHGPGAMAESKRGTRYKYGFHDWSPRLEAIFPFDQFGLSSPDVRPEDLALGWPAEADYPSRLLHVPKTAKGPRLIAAEPGANQWIQQGLLRYITSAIDRRSQDIGRSIGFHDQWISAAKALDASRTAAYATVDLKSASDRLSCWMVQRIFRANNTLLSAMSASRTRYLSNRVDKKRPKTIELRKFATMGSALTFPVQSICFFVLAIACVLDARGLPANNWRSVCSEVQVYGDDMIVPMDSLAGLRSLLSVVGLVVNSQKTFGGRNFRESCGMDAFRGYDVTPVRPKQLPFARKPSSILAAVDTANLLHRKGLWYAANAIRALVDVEGSIPLVGVESGLWGDKTFVQNIPEEIFSRGSKTRWNAYLHRYEHRYYQPKSIVSNARRSEGAENLLQFFTEDPTGQILTNWRSGETSTSDASISRRWVSRDSLARDPLDE